MKYRVAFIGSGYMASEHIKAFAKIDGVCLSGIYSKTNKNSIDLANKYGIQNIANSISDLYNKTQAHLVVVCVPELSLRSVCEEVFHYPWFCLLEKPAGYNLDDARQILKASKEMHANAYVALNRRHFSSTKLALEILSQDSGKRIINILDQEGQAAAKLAGQPQLVVDNWMYANSIHLIDYLIFYGRGDIISVDNIIPWNPSYPECVLSKLQFSSGDIGIYQAVWDRPGPWAVSITTSNTWVEMKPLEALSIKKSNTRHIETLKLSDLDEKYKPGLMLQAMESIKAISGIKHTLPSLQDAFESMKLVHSIYFDGE